VNVSLWDNASQDVEAEHLARRVAMVQVELNKAWPFLGQARSMEEFEHRKAMAVDTLYAIALANDMPMADLDTQLNAYFTASMEARYPKTAEAEGPFVVVDNANGATVAGPFATHEQAADALASNESGMPSTELSIQSQEPTDEGEDDGDVEKEARRKVALPEGMDPVLPMVSQSPQGAGQAEKYDEHSVDSDFSGGYSEVPAGPPGVGPAQNPYVPNQQTAMRRHALGGAGEPVTDSGPRVGQDGSLTTSPIGQEPIQTSQEAPSPLEPPAMSMELPLTTKPRVMPDGAPPQSVDPNAMSQMPGMGVPAPGAGMAPTADTGAADPIASKIDQVAASVRVSNPGMSVTASRKVARKVVAKHYRPATARTASGDDGIDYTGDGSNNRPDDDDKDEHHGGAGMAGAAGAGAAMRVLPLLAL
jgi:hypothetical protein